MRWLLAGAVIVGVALVFGRQGNLGPRVPRDPNEILERVPSSTPSVRTLRALETAARERPDDVAAAVAAAQKAIELARRESDPRYLGRAQAVLQKWWAEPNPPVPVRVLRATIHQAQHDFDGARVDLEQLDDPQAKLTLATVEAVTGRYPQASAACARLEGRASPLVVTTCHAQVDSLTGRARDARAALERALAAAPRAAERAWAWSVLGEVCERAGDDSAAEAAYRQALALEPDDGYTLNAMADLLLALGRPHQVEPLLAARTSDDNSLLRLAIAERQRLGKPGSYAQMLKARYAAAAQRGDTVHLREQARAAWEVDSDAPAALELAERNWATQKEPADAKVLLDAAHAARQPQRASAVVQWLLDAGSEEPRLLQRVRRFSDAPDSSATPAQK